MQLIGSRLKTELPKIKILWKRGRQRIDWTKALIYLVLGKKGAGKSALLEVISLYYPKILDLFGSQDDEGLGYCRDSSPVDDILLIHGDNVDLKCSWDTCKVSNFSYSKLLDYECVIPSHSFFTSLNSKFAGLEKIMKVLWDRREWKKPIYITVREASSFLYSRIKQEGVNMKGAKADFVYWQREMRHFGYALGIDTIRWHSIDKEMRDLADYLIFKKVGAQGLPDDVSFVYRYIHPLALANCPPSKFYTVTENASIGEGMSEYPLFHKEEGIDIIKELGIVLEYGEEPEESSIRRIGDEEHAEIVRLYNSGLSQENIAKEIKRSSATVNKHIKRHNKEVNDYGICSKCKRASSDLLDVEIDIR